MSDSIPITCPQCGGNVLKTYTRPQANKEFPDAVCANCGAPFGEDDIRKQAKKIADDLITKMKH